MGLTKDQLFAEARERVLSETNLRNLTPGSIVKAILDIQTSQTGQLYQYLDSRMLNAFVSTAKGQWLDRIGILVGKTRLRPTFANVQVRFFINPDLDLSADEVIALLQQRGGTGITTITIPAGTVVIAGDRSYSLSEAAVIETGMTEVTVRAVATAAGTFGNAEPGAVTKVVWNDPVLTILDGIVLVTNDAPAENARDSQTDDEFRFTIVNAVTDSAKANETAVRNACLSVPGVSEVQIIKYSYGIGTFTVFVTTTSPLVTRGTLEAVQAAIDATQAEGAKGIAQSPTLLGIKLLVTLTFRPNTKAVDKTRLTTEVQNTLISYINNLRAGEAFIVNEAVQRIMAVSDQILDSSIDQLAMGTFDITNGTITDLDTTLLVANQTTEWNEKFCASRQTISVCHI